MKATGKKSDKQSAFVPRLVRFPLDDDEWLKAKAKEKAQERGRATVQDCVREIIRQAREQEAAAA